MLRKHFYMCLNPYPNKGVPLTFLFPVNGETDPAAEPVMNDSTVGRHQCLKFIRCALTLIVSRESEQAV